MAELAKILEAILFVSAQPVSVTFLASLVNDFSDKEEESEEVAGEKGESREEQEAVPRVSEADLLEALALVREKFDAEDHAFELREVAGGYQFFTKRAYFPYVKKAVLEHNQKRLSRAAMETLSIIAYRQPVTKAEIEFIRGVNCDYAVQKLLDKKLISITGRADGPGRPLQYGSSPFFMEYFGLKDISELPKLKEFEALEDEHLERFRQQQASEASQDPSSHEQEEPEEALLDGSTEENLS